MDPESKDAEKREARLARKRVVERVRKANLVVKQAAEIQQGERMCRAHARVRDENGEVVRDADGKALTRPCKQKAIRGGFVCWNHGGKAPQVRKKAEKRLLALVEPSIIRLEALMQQEEHLPTALAAVRTVLERAGDAAIGALKQTSEKDTRPIINIGIKVGGIEQLSPLGPLSPQVSIAALPGITTGEVVGDEHNG
jgi:hypothetical protein